MRRAGKEGRYVLLEIREDNRHTDGSGPEKNPQEDRMVLYNQRPRSDTNDR